jgi:alkylation response protein AidB-like acyl-CoA dehydrogenase
MNLTFTPEQIALHERLAGVGAQLGGDLIERDRSERFDRKDWTRLAEQSVFALPIPREYGGLAETPVTCAHALEGLGRGCRDNGLLVGAGAHIWAVELPIWKFGTQAQCRHYLPRLIDGRMIGAHAITEADAGSDALAMSATADRDGDLYLLNGQKRFVTNAPVADVFLVYATVNPKLGFTGVTAFLVHRDQPGLTVETTFEKSGLRTMPWGEVTLTNCRIPASQRLGREKQGGQVFATTMAWERSLILAPLLGAMRRQIDACVEHARTRRQFGKPIGKLQSVSNAIVDMHVRLEAARMLTYRAAAELASGSPAPPRSPLPEIAKLYTSEAAVETFLAAIQVFGGYGYTVNAEIERNLRDAIGTRISSGTSDVQRFLIAAKLGVLDPPLSQQDRLPRSPMSQ